MKYLPLVILLFAAYLTGAKFPAIAARIGVV